jgi:hypothetical protein
MYFGLDGSPRMTLEEIGRQLGISYAAVQDRRNWGLKKLGVTLPPRSAIPTRTVWQLGAVHGNRKS